jgi:hypothetical protein
MNHTHNVWSQGPTSDNSFSGEQDAVIREKSEKGIESSQSSEDLFLKLALDSSDNKEQDDSGSRLERREVSKSRVFDGNRHSCEAITFLRIYANFE